VISDKKQQVIPAVTFVTCALVASSNKSAGEKELIMGKGNGSGGKGSGGWPSTTGNPSGGGRTNGGKGK